MAFSFWMLHKRVIIVVEKRHGDFVKQSSDSKSAIRCGSMPVLPPTHNSIAIVRIARIRTRIPVERTIVRDGCLDAVYRNSHARSRIRKKLVRKNDIRSRDTVIIMRHFVRKVTHGRDVFSTREVENDLSSDRRNCRCICRRANARIIVCLARSRSIASIRNEIRRTARRISRYSRNVRRYGLYARLSVSRRFSSRFSFQDIKIRLCEDATKENTDYRYVSTIIK
jgi:hypothetical protein